MGNRDRMRLNVDPYNYYINLCTSETICVEVRGKSGRPVPRW